MVTKDTKEKVDLSEQAVIRGAAGDSKFGFSEKRTEREIDNPILLYRPPHIRKQLCTGTLGNNFMCQASQYVIHFIYSRKKPVDF